MGTKLTAADIEAAASKAAESAVSLRGGRGGNDSRQVDWTDARAKACQKILADPDIIVYYSYLASNGLRAQVKILHGFLCEAIVLAESCTYRIPASRQSSTAGADRADAQNKLLTELRSVGGGSGSVERLKARASDFISPIADALISKSGVERGSSSPKYFRAVLGECLLLAKEFQDRMLDLPGPVGRLNAVLTKGAINPLLGKSYRAISEISSEEGISQVMDLVTSVAAMDAYSRPASSAYKVHTGKDHPYPVLIEIDLTEGTILLYGESKNSLDPSLLSISQGDIVSSASGMRAEILSIEDGKIFLPVEDMPAVVPSSIMIRSPAQEAYLGLFPILNGVSLSALPELGALYRQPAVREMTRPDSAKFAEKLAKLAAELSPLTSEAELSLQRLSLSVPLTEDGGLVTALEGYSPTFKTTTVSAGDSVLDMMRDRGFNLVESKLLRGRLDSLQEDNAFRGSSVGVVETAVSTFNGLMYPESDTI